MREVISFIITVASGLLTLITVITGLAQTGVNSAKKDTQSVKIDKDSLALHREKEIWKDSAEYYMRKRFEHIPEKEKLLEGDKKLQEKLIEANLEQSKTIILALSSKQPLPTIITFNTGKREIKLNASYAPIKDTVIAVPKKRFWDFLHFR
jgi:hypothetical protein